MPSGATAADRTVPSQRTTAPIQSAIAPVARPPAPAAVNPPSLREESGGPAAMQTALGAHDGHRALALLDTQDRDCRAGSLGQERPAARALALRMAGQQVDAVAAKDRFILQLSRVTPDSPHQRHVRKMNISSRKRLLPATAQ